MNTTAKDTKVNPNDYNQIWHRFWNNKDIPWDAGDISPALRELIVDKKWPLPTGQGIVPGCGSGYDAMFLASPQLHMTGADLDATAVETADKLREEKGISADLVDFKVVDFFKFAVPESKYQVAYDYTFFCAIHPSMREDWGKRYAEIMSPGGELIVLMFPLKKDDNLESGPPFLVSENAYHEVLDKNFELVHIDHNSKGHDKRRDAEAISVWRRK